MKTFINNWLYGTACIGIVWIMLSNMGYTANVVACDRKGQLAADILQSRLDGETEKANLEALKTAQDENKAKGIAVPHHVYVDYQRLIRDIFRKHEDEYIHTDWTLEGIAKKEKMYCLDVGF